MQEERFHNALRPCKIPSASTRHSRHASEIRAIRKRRRTSSELDALVELHEDQWLSVNGRFHATDTTDATAVSIEKQQTEAVAAMPTSLGKLPRDEVPLIGFDIVGIAALRALISSSEPPPAKCEQEFEALDLPGLDQLVDEIARGEKGAS